MSAPSSDPPTPPPPPRRPTDRSGTGGVDSFDPESVLYHANGLLVIDKPAGVPVHAGEGHETGIVEDLKAWVSLHPGVLDVAIGAKLHPLNLLEREASGVLAIALSKKIARRVKESIDRATSEFAAVIAGPLGADAPGDANTADTADTADTAEERVIEGEIRGKIRSRVGGRFQRVDAALTYRVLRTDERLSLVVARPDGHRAHQVRALFAGAGRPLAGDDRYGKPAPAEKFRERFGVPGLLLHHASYHLPASVLGQDLLFEAPWPDAFHSLVRAKEWPALG